MEIKPGSTWRDRDPRRSGRTVKVEKVEGGFVHVVSSAGAKSKIAVARFGDPTKKGFELVPETASAPQA